MKFKKKEVMLRTKLKKKLLQELSEHTAMITMTQMRGKQLKWTQMNSCMLRQT